MVAENTHVFPLKNGERSEEKVPNHLLKIVNLLLVVFLSAKACVKGLEWVKIRVVGLFELWISYFCVVHWVFMAVVQQPLLVAACLYTIIFTSYWWIFVFYGIWFCFDKETHRRGGRPQKWYKNCFLWRYYQRYFPLKLEKTVDLPADRNYLFGYHPHGLLCLGVPNLGGNASGFDEIFPGLITHPLTLRVQFYIPFRREYLMLSGCSEVTERNIRYILGHPDKGHVAIICIGGTREQYETQAGAVRLVLNERKGFIQMALKNG